MAEVSIHTVDGRYRVYTPFKYKDLLKSITGAKWDKEAKCWTYARGSFTAQEIAQKFVGKFEADDEFTTDAAIATEASKAQAYKVSQSLPDIPVTKLPAWQHQRQAFWFAKEQQAAMLAMDMGTGKTKVTIDLIQNRGHKLVLILCPKKVVDVWPSEFDKHCAVPFRMAALKDGSITQRTEEARRFASMRSSYPDTIMAVVINYDAARCEPFKTWSLNQKWDAVICDESHKIKAPGGDTSRYAQNVGKRALYKYCLTGTPLPHSPLDAYGQYRFLDPSIFGTSFALFRARYAIMGGFQGREILGWQNQEDFNKKFYRIAYRVGAEVLDLPEYHHINRYCTLEPEAARIYRELYDDFITFLDGTEDGEVVTAPNVLVKLLRLQQITSGYLGERQISKSKQELLEEVLDEIGAEPAVVFCKFTHDIDLIKAIATKQGRVAFELSGRTDELQAWKDCPDSGSPVLAVNIQAGGAGIDLTKSRYSIYYSSGYSLGDYEQSLKRVHRPGQTRATTYIHLLVKGSIDVKVQRALDERKQVVEEILSEH